jgi:peptidoglycan/LPS O-acetylase OafA/YrhL
MAGFLGRAAIVLVVLLLSLAVGVLVADHIPYARPATSFDTVFSRLLGDVWTATAAGIVLGSILSCRWRRDREAGKFRRDQSMAIGIVLLLVWTLLVASA